MKNSSKTNNQKSDEQILTDFLHRAKTAAENDYKRGKSHNMAQYKTVKGIMQLATRLKKRHRRAEGKKWLIEQKRRVSGKTDFVSLSANLACQDLKKKGKVDRKWISKRACAARKLKELKIEPAEVVKYLSENGGLKALLEQKRAESPLLRSDEVWKQLSIGKAGYGTTKLDKISGEWTGPTVLFTTVKDSEAHIVRVFDGERADRLAAYAVRLSKESLGQRKERSPKKAKKRRKMADW